MMKGMGGGLHIHTYAEPMMKGTGVYTYVPMIKGTGGLHIRTNNEGNRGLHVR